MKLLTITAVILPLLLSNCAQRSGITSAPHRTAVANTVTGTIVHSHPITTSKNNGVGGALGSIGGSIGGSKIGSGAGRFAGSIIGSIIGGTAGSAAETKVREESAQEVVLEINGKSHRLITHNKRLYKQGDKVSVTTNVYGTPLNIL